MRTKYKVIERFKVKYPIIEMCKFFEVSKSGYYAWRKPKPDKDSWLKSEIFQCQQKSRYTYGYRRVTKWIYKHSGTKVNHKAVLRVMRETNMFGQIRRPRAFTRYKTAVYKHPNLLEREFNQEEKNKIWVTDITFIPTKAGMYYMCSVMDLCGKMILSYKIGSVMDFSLVSASIRRAIQKVGTPEKIHSDQGAQYSCGAYHALTREYNFEASMSRRGCPYDNSPMENFFGILKSKRSSTNSFLFITTNA